MRFRAVLVALTGLALLAPDAHAVGPNLLPNPGFEDGVNKTTAPGVDQPLLPTGWAFEGAAGLFDHTPQERRTGRYAAGISIPAGGKRRFCLGPTQAAPGTPAAPGIGCHPLTPANTAKDSAAQAFSVNPAWRPLNPLALTAQRTYIVAGYVSWSFATLDEGGAKVQVRWLDGTGVPIRTDAVWTLVPKTKLASDSLNWTRFQVTVTAPAGATHAVPLFGAHDDIWNSKIVYDDVSFQTA